MMTRLYRLSQAFFALLLLFFFNIFLFFSAQSQKTKFEHFTVEEGMQNNIVLQATQDAKGLMWFATMTGIDRFDGNRFIHYPLPLKTGGYSAYSQVPFILSDEGKQIWSASANAVYRYNTKKDAFELPAIVNGRLEKNRTITSFAAGNNNNLLLVGTSSGFFIYNHTEQKIIAADNFGQYVRCVFQDNKGLLWVGTNKGLRRFVINGAAINELPNTAAALNQLNDFPVSHVSQDVLGRYWIVSTDKGLFVYDEGSAGMKQVALPKSNVRPYTVKDIYHDKSKAQSYITLDGAGLVIADKEFNIIANYQTNEDDLTTLSNNAAYDIFCDSYNRIWITTYGGGVNAVLPSVQPFVNFLHEINNSNSLSNNAAKAITEDAEGNLWFGTRKGISKYNPLSKSWLQINEDTKAPAYTSDNVLVLAAGSNNQIWAGTYGGGLIKIDAQTNQVHSYLTSSSDSNSIGTDYVYAVLHDSKGRVWAGGIRGPLSYLNLATGLFTRIKTMVSSVYCILEDSHGRVIVGTEKGIFEVVEGKLNNLFPEIGTEKILAIVEYSPQKYWLGTLGGGIIIVSTTKGVEQIFKTNDGLPSDVICALIKDRNGDVWAGTSKGIAHYQFQTKNFTVYTKADGLAGSQVNYGASYYTRNGEMIFGTTDGFSAFNPQNIRARGYKPVIVFTGISVNNKQVEIGVENSPLTEQLDELPVLKLKHNQNSFTIDFVNTSPSLSGKHLYSWKLEGFDKEWSKPSVIPSAVYTNLNSGNYSLLVKAFSKGQTEEQEMRKLEIKILTPWWKSGWAYAGYLLILTGGFFAGYQYYQSISARKKYAERLRLNTSISHEIRTPLTLIKGPVGALANSTSLSDENRNNMLLAKKNIEKLESIISQFIDFQKTGVNKMQMQVKKADMVALLDDVSSSFIPLMKEKNIHFTYTKPSEKIELLFDRDKMEKIFNNLISNAVKYTPAKHDISVFIEKDNKHLIINVADTGIGIPQGQQQFIFKGYFRADNTVNLKETGSGIGLNVAKELVEMHHGKLSFKSEQDKGTVFTIKIPLQNESLQQYLVKDKYAVNEIEIPDLQNTQGKMQGNKQIVIAEDNDELRQYLERELTQAGYKVLSASNGAAAFLLVQKKHTDIVITDVMMPEMNGFQLCEKLKKELSTCHIPVIMLTAIHDKDYLLEGYRCGADDYVKKPFDLAYIITRIESLLQDRTRFRNKIMSVFEQEEAIVENDAEVTWLKTATEMIVENVSDPGFSVEKLSSMMTMSRPVLFRKFKAITGESPQNYINQIRMRKAVELLQQRKLNINEVAYESGFTDPKYFSTAFKKHFGKTPSEYLKEIAAG